MNKNYERDYFLEAHRILKGQGYRYYMGLLLLLHQGDEIVGVNKQCLKIRRGSGSVNIFNKSLSSTKERVLLHELVDN